MHRAESILDAIKTQLTGLTTTGANVDRDRVYPPESLPALSVNQGTESPVDDPSMTFQDCELEVLVEIQLKDPDKSTELNQIKAEVYAAILATPQLGLGYVHNTLWRGDLAPQPSGEMETKSNSCIMRFDVHYRHSYASKEA